MARTDDELMISLSAGDVAAAGELVERHRRRLLTYLRRLLGSLEWAEDLFQETFVRLYETRDRFEARGRFSQYLFTIATHLAYRELRRAGRFVGCSLEDPLDRVETGRRVVDVYEIRYEAPAAGRLDPGPVSGRYLYPPGDELRTEPMAGVVQLLRRVSMI